MRFSERKGYKEVSKIIQKEGMTDELRNTLWNVLYLNIIKDWSYQGGYEDFRDELWLKFFKIPLDQFRNLTFLAQYELAIQTIKDFYFEAEWYEVYDFLEFTVSFYWKKEDLTTSINEILEKELSAYRIINGIFTDITDEQEIEMLEEALADNDFPNVKAHLQRALELLSDRKNPDYRNSIKESISAVESLAKEITRDKKADLEKAIRVIENKGKFHGALRGGLSKLYAYTSDANGIRHSLMDEPNLNVNDAKFFLLICTSFINYLKTKI